MSGTRSHSFRFMEALVATGLIAGCGLSARNMIPSEFIQQAEPGVTLTALTTHPDLYQDKVVIVGGVPLAEIREGDRLWIELRNRPLDANYVPHRPSSRGGPEDGHYWVLVSSRDFPPTSHTWARVTVVGRVLARPLSAPPPVTAEQGPVLAALYVHAWPVDESRAETWQDRRNAQYGCARRNGAFSASLLDLWLPLWGRVTERKSSHAV
ncbi:MAG: Slp family lipoprotein [Nitrospirota bacterium]|nr:Slp family lipoprotein [Nitrospirota bacterium]